MTQNQQILELLKSGRKLTALDALAEVGCFRLAARIKDLRDTGHKIITLPVKVNGKRYARYELAS